MTETLERITTELLQNDDSLTPRALTNRIHVAGMLAFVEASREVVNKTTMPTPLYRLSYDPDAHNVEFDILEGRARVPKEGALDINMLDMLVGTLLKEKMPLLFEGKTGVGKTFTVEQFCKTVLPKENYRGLRLNRAMTNVLQPYIEGKVEGGVVKISLRREELDKIAMIFIDEVNRGDSNQVLQLQDGTIRLATGEAGEFGIPIPRYNPNGVDGKWTTSPDDKRPLFVVSAQNPPATKDAKYAATRRTDAAQGNRDLQIDMPNQASDIGAGVLLLDTSNGQHGKFMNAYQSAFARNLGLSTLDSLAGIKDDWMSTYAFVTDPKRTVCPSIQSSVEFMDALLIMVSPDLKAVFEHEKDTASDWNDALKKHGLDFSYTSTLTTGTNSIIKIHDIVRTFKEDVITRDILKVKKLSDAVSLVRRVKGAFDSDNPVNAYMNLPNYVNIQDVASGFAIMLHDKQDVHDEDPVVLIDTVLREYIGIVEDFSKVRYKEIEFNPNDPNMSVYVLAVGKALHAAGKSLTMTGKLAGAVGVGKTKTQKIIGDLGKSVAVLKRLEGGNEYRKPILGRMIADLTTLAGFTSQYASELDPLLDKCSSQLQARSVLTDFYSQKRGEVSTPDIYIHRLTRVLGV